MVYAKVGTPVIGPLLSVKWKIIKKRYTKRVLKNERPVFGPVYYFTIFYIVLEFDVHKDGSPVVFR